MLTSFRSRQRTRTAREHFCSLSFLPQDSPGVYRDFHGLTWFLETLLQPRGMLTRSPSFRTEYLLAAIGGAVRVGLSDQEPVEVCRDQIVRLVPRPDQSIEIMALESGDPAAPEVAVFLEIALESPQVDDPGTVHRGPVELKPPFPCFVTVASGSADSDGLALAADVHLHWARLRAGENLMFETSPSRASLLLLLNGTVQVGECRLLRRDWVLIERESELRVSAAQASRFLLLDLPGELPRPEV